MKCILYVLPHRRPHIFGHPFVHQTWVATMLAAIPFTNGYVQNIKFQFELYGWYICLLAAVSYMLDKLQQPYNARITRVGWQTHASVSACGRHTPSIICDPTPANEAVCGNILLWAKLQSKVRIGKIWRTSR